MGYTTENADKKVTKIGKNYITKKNMLGQKGKRNTRKNNNTT